MCGVSGDVGGGTLSHNLGSAGWPSPSPLLCVPHPRAGLTSHHPRPPNLWPSPSPGHSPLDMHRPGGAHWASTHTPAHPPGWLPAATPPSPHSLLLPADQPGAQQGLKTPIFLLAWTYEQHSVLQFCWRASPSPRWTSSAAVSGDLASARPLLSFPQHKLDPSIPTLNLPCFLIESLEGSLLSTCRVSGLSRGLPKASQTPNEKRITLGIWEKAKVHDFQDKIPESLLEPGPSCSLVFRMQEALVPGPC